MARPNHEIYPNSPLIDVACEIRFPGEMQVDCERHLFWEKIRSDYPDIVVPSAQPGQAPALQHYRFHNTNQDRTVLVALNSLSYSEAQYRGNKKFIAEYVRLVRLFGECYPKIDQIGRIGWRYVNVIPFVRESGCIPIQRFVKFESSLPQTFGNETRAIQLRTEIPFKDGLIILQMQNVSRNDQPGFEGLQIDIDYVKQGPRLRIRDVPAQITQAHTRARQLFEDFITDDYREYLRGHTL